jgi:hypothetical protein
VNWHFDLEPRRDGNTSDLSKLDLPASQVDS